MDIGMERGDRPSQGQVALKCLNSSPRAFHISE